MAADIPYEKPNCHVCDVPGVIQIKYKIQVLKIKCMLYHFFIFKISFLEFGCTSEKQKRGFLVSVTNQSLQENKIKSIK